MEYDGSYPQGESQETPVCKFTTELFADFTSDEMMDLKSGTKQAIAHDILLSNNQGARILASVEISNNADSIDNPFKQALAENLDHDIEEGKSLHYQQDP